MGTDIHLVVQADYDKSHTWVDVPCPERLEWHDEYETEGSWYSDRNYDAFAILANVRNGRGFAGVVTGDTLIPISEPRGLPAGVTAADGDGYKYGEHSFSWLTLHDLVSYPHWDKVRVSVGVVSATLYIDEDLGNPARANQRPSSYSGGVFGGGTRIMTEAEFIAAGKPVDPKTYVSIGWPEKYSYSAGRLYSCLIPSLCAWADAKGLTYDRVRLVFGFDS